jgi:CrcB protein
VKGRPRAGTLVLILVGGTVGTLARAVLEDAAPAASDGVPWMTLGINVTGSFLLGLLLEVLTRTGSDTGWRRATRLTLGTGVLGGFTTYSTFAVEVSQRASTAPHLTGPAYAVVSVVLGAAAAALGYLAAHRIRSGGRRVETRR